MNNRRCTDQPHNKNWIKQRENPGLISETVFRLGVFAEVDGSSFFFCRAEEVALSQSVASNDFRRLKVSDFLAGYGNDEERQPKRIPELPVSVTREVFEQLEKN